MMRLSVLTRRRMKGSTSFFKVAATARDHCPLLDGHLEGLAELRLLAQIAGIEEVEDGPEIAQPVLDGRAGQGQAMRVPPASRIARVCAACGFLMFCASSTTTRCQCTLRRSFSSRRASAKEVRTTSCGLTGRREALLVLGARAALVDQRAQLRREALDLLAPVAQHRGRRDDQGREARLAPACPPAP